MCVGIQDCGCGCTGSRVMFLDRVTFNKDEKSIISVRDGVQEYLGIELGMADRANDTFKVYRSKDTIAKIVDAMIGIPVTDGHVSTDEPVPESSIVTNVTDSTLIEITQDDTATTVAVKNKVAITDNVIQLVSDGTNELSLGYHGDLIEHDEYDFEQTNIRPHHLAIVEYGRCGPICKFQDKRMEQPVKGKIKKLLTSFKDQEGPLTLQQLLELVGALPEAIKQVPMEQLQDLGPALMSVIEAAKEAGVTVEATTEEPASEEPASEEPASEEPASEELTDEEMQDAEIEIPQWLKKKPLYEQRKWVEEEMRRRGMKVPEKTGPKNMGFWATKDEDMEEDKKEGFSDADVRKFVDKAIQIHTSTIQKAQKFLDESYDFKGKSTNQIMRDVIATQLTEEFTDAELPIVFKTIQPVDSKYRNFADASADEFQTIRDKEL